MRKRLSFKLFYTMIAAMAFIISCSDDATVLNENELPQVSFIANLDAAGLAATASSTYAHLQTQGLYQRFAYILPDTFSDEMVPSEDANFLPSSEFRITPILDQTALYWTACYNGISRCNFLLRNEEAIRARIGNSDITEADADMALGEARFMRGLFYFFLVKRYGGVPLELDEETPLTGIPRSSVDETYAAIISDLQQATQLLPTKETLAAEDIGRATRGAALGMLGKVFLQRGMHAEARQVLSEITGYTLLPREQYRDNFNDGGEFNDESMFEVIFTGEDAMDQRWNANGVGLGEVTFHAQEYTGWGNARPSQKMIDEYEPDDHRLADHILLPGDTFGAADDQVNTNGNLWFKFSQLYENDATTDFGATNARVLRFSDVVLMQAEVENALGNDAAAIDFLNQLRTRSELPLYGSAEMDSRGFPVTTPAEVFNAIVHERMVELSAEQSRFDDLIRWNLDAQELAVDDNGFPRGYSPDIHRLMPIPQTEIDTNDALTTADQNPGF
ncbi:RagB/SusD family nutrient uptake outer membrane protein [Spongiimicrobium salis]|uniref:RagB/SusD family nutrient uptake outer membrane protein n=1 Tax=Spongiimicrobium salis TaxID=1667022 RepID=UPI00374D81D4